MWGPSIWYLLHTLSFSSQCEQKKETIKRFFLFLGHHLPCCKPSFQSFLQEYPLHTRIQPYSLARWTFHLHNTINMKLNKATPSFQTVFLFYHLTPCNHTLLFQALHYLSQWTTDSSWLSMVKEIFPCDVCRENLCLVEEKDWTWKKIAFSWISAHTKEALGGWEGKHQATLSYSMVNQKRIYLLHNPRQVKNACVVRWLPVLPQTKYKLVFSGKSPRDSAKIYLLHPEKYIISFEDHSLLEWNETSQEVFFTTPPKTTLLQVRIQLPCILEPTSLYSFEVNQFRLQA